MTSNDWSRASDARDTIDSTVIADASPANVREAGDTRPAHYRHGSLKGRYLGAYWLKELLAVGGMAEVYRARDVARQRVVAVKVLADHLAEDAGYVAQFRNEARRAARLRHRNVVPLYDVGEDTVGERRVLYLVMPLLRQSLSQRLRREGSLPYPEALRLTLEATDGLRAAHAAGLIHCDVKPGNILLDAGGHALLCDFGVALDTRAAPRQDTEASEVAPLSPSATTRPAPQESGEWVAGTPAYMAPEQLCGGAVDQRADVYSLGVVLYQLLTGQRPFEGETPLDIARHALRDPIVPPSTVVPDRTLPLGLDRVLLTALARDPRDRFDTMDEFATALRRVRDDPVGSWGAAPDTWEEWDQWPTSARLIPAIQRSMAAPVVAHARRAYGAPTSGAKRLLCVAALAASLACAAGITTMLHSWDAAGMPGGAAGLSVAIPASEARPIANAPRIVITPRTPTPTPTPSNVGGGQSGVGEAALVSPAMTPNPHAHIHERLPGKGKHGHGQQHGHSQQHGHGHGN